MSVFVSSLLAQGDAEWIYKGSDGKVYAADSNLVEGDAFSWKRLLPSLNTSSFSWSDATSTSYLEDGITIYFGSNSKYYRQYFKLADDYEAYSRLNNATNITSRYHQIESSKGIDIDGDGYEGTPPPTISKVLIRAESQPHWGEAYYLTTKGDLIASQAARKYAPGDIHNSQTFYYNFSPQKFSKDQLIARQGLDTLWFYNESTGKLYQQNFREGTEWEIRIPSGSTSDLTSQIDSLEEDWGVDINRNGIVGERKPVIEEIIFEDSYSDRYLHLLDDGSYVITEGGYDAGETISGGQKIIGANASLLNNALAFNWIDNGFELLIRHAASGGFAIQRFSEIGRSNNYSKAGKLKPIDQNGDKFFYWETDRSSDFNNDGSIGEKDAVVRNVLLPASVSLHDEGFYRTTDDKIIMVREDLQRGESPADWYRELVDKSGNPYDFKDGPKAFDWAKNGFVVVFKDNVDFKLQKFNESNDIATASGSTRLITDSLSNWEEKTSVDIDGNGYLGEESATVKQVLYTGLEGHVENGVYLDQNGDLFFSEPDLDKGDVASFSRPFLDKNGNSFQPDIELRAMDWGDRGPTLIYQLKNKYYMQQFREVGEAMTANGQVRDITGKISRYEDQLGIDIDKDGYYGDQLPEITEVLFDGLDGYREVGVYRTSTQSVIISDSGLVKGETPNFVSNVVDKDGNPFEPGDRVAGVGDARDGFTLVYQVGNKYMEQIFKELNDFSRPNGKPKNVTGRLAKLEEQYSIDLDNNGKYGKEAAVITGVLFDGSEGFGGRGVYRLQTGELIASESEMSVGDTPNYFISILNEDGYPFEPGARFAGLRDARSGFSVLYLSEDSSKYYEQIFKEIGDFARPHGKPKNITKKIKKLEDDLAIDLDRDGLFGRQDPAVLKVHDTGGDDQFEHGLYTLQNGDLILADPDLEIDDTPRNLTTFVDSQGEAFVVSGAIKGVSPSSKGVDLIYLDGGAFYAQPFREAKDYLRQNGKPQNITKNIYKLESKMDYDFTGDGLYGKPDAVVRSVEFAGKNQEFGVYTMSDATTLIAESGLRKGDTPFEYIGQLASKSKNNESYSLEGNPTGVVEIKNGFALIMESGGKYLAQQFNFSGDMLREKGRLSNVSSKIEKYEAEYFIDFNGDGVIAGGE